MVSRVNTSLENVNYWIVGLGRVGSLVARLVSEHERLSGITVQSAEDAERGRRFGSHVDVTTDVPERLPPDTIVLLCVPDASLLGVASLWAESGAAGFVHFSGALGVVAMSARVGSLDVAALHPLLSVSSEDMDVDEARGVTFGLSGEGRAHQAALQLAEWFGGNVVELDEESRAAWHLAATIASNGVYALLNVATQIAAANGIIGFDIERGLASLAAQSARSAAVHGAIAGATGPVVRGDALTVDKHLRVMNTSPDAKALYVEMTRALIDIAEMRGVGDRQLAALRSLIETAVTPDF